MKLAVVGVTGMVGQEILKVLKESDIKIDEFIPVASERSTGKKLIFDNKEYIITGIQNAIDQKPDITIFSAGGFPLCTCQTGFRILSFSFWLGYFSTLVKYSSTVLGTTSA